MYARFRKRITFPIANEQGKTIAFTARALDGADVDAKAGPKYLNSPETPLYTKGQVLFNLDKAKASIRELDIALLVEGQMDCISVFMGECAGDQWDGVYRAPGAAAVAVYQARGAELRSRPSRSECGGEDDCAAGGRGF
jgi:hypothetical protein